MTRQPITAILVENLRNETGREPGICKHALERYAGDVEKARAWIKYAWHHDNSGDEFVPESALMEDIKKLRDDFRREPRPQNPVMALYFERLLALVEQLIDRAEL